VAALLFGNARAAVVGERDREPCGSVAVAEQLAKPLTG
jgi:hypothetical protein